jgi:hypothetical protein
MFKDILNCFDLSKRNDFLTLVTSESIDGSFFLHHLLSCAIRSKQQIYFFNLSQTWLHYKSIQIKLGNGNQLAEMIDNSKLVNFDLMNAFQENLMNNEYEFGKQNNFIIKMFEQFYSNHLNNLAERTKEKVMIIIDDLSVLELIGINENFIFEFMQKLNKVADKVNLVIYSQILNSNLNLVNELTHLADSHIQIGSLLTGYSKEIQGQVNFCKYYNFIYFI